MFDWFRQFLMPLAVVTIVATVWSLAWANEVKWQAYRAARQGGCQVTIHDDADGTASVQLSTMPKPAASNAVASRDDGDQ